MFEETLTLNGELFSFIKKRRRGGAVYRNRSGTRYARVGTRDEIHDEALHLRELHHRGFPTPEIIHEDSLDEQHAFFIECSVGTETFGMRFEQETTLQNTISDATFTSFLKVLERYSNAQAKKENWLTGTFGDVEHALDLHNVLRNNPPDPTEEANFFEALKCIWAQIQHVPFGFSQSDLNAYNILDGGVIDFEYACKAPLGFDTLTALYTPDFWPPIARRFSFLDHHKKQGEKILEKEFTENHAPAPQLFREEFLVLKAIRATAKSKESEEHPACNPSFWRWRTRVRAEVISAYLKGTSIDTQTFVGLGGEVKVYPEHHGH